MADIPTFSSPEHLTGYLDQMRDGSDDEALSALSQMGGGILSFTGAVYPGLLSTEIYGQVHEREAQGSGPHFDLYGPYIHDDYPWISVYNLSGLADVRTVAVPQQMAAMYDDMYPDPTPEARDARRNFAALALGAPEAASHGRLQSGMGLVLSQRLDGPYVAHEVLPRTEPAGHFVKIVAVAAGKDALEKLVSEGFVTLDTLVTENIRSAATVNDPDDRAGTAVERRLRRRYRPRLLD